MQLVVLLCIFIVSISNGRNIISVRKDAFAIGVSRSDSAAEYDFISEITAKMKIQRFRLAVFENPNEGEKLLLSGKIDAIIAKINYSPHLERKFLASLPYCKTEIAVALPANNRDIWTLSDLNGKNLAFIPKEVSSEQIANILPNANLSAARGINEALSLLQKGEAKAIAANRQTLEALNSSELRILPNRLAENDVVALFAPDSKSLHEEFNNAVKKNQGLEKAAYKKRDAKKIIFLLNELKKEIELLQEELK